MLAVYVTFGRESHVYFKVIRPIYISPTAIISYQSDLCDRKLLNIVTTCTCKTSKYILKSVHKSWILTFTTLPMFLLGTFEYADFKFPIHMIVMFLYKVLNYYNIQVI